MISTTNILEKTTKKVHAGEIRSPYQILRNINVCAFVAAANVVDLTNFCLEKDDLKRSRNVLYEQEVALV